MLSNYVIFTWVLGVITNFLVIITLISGLLIVLFFMTLLAGSFEYAEEERIEDCKKIAKISLIVFLISLPLVLLVPSERVVCTYVVAKQADEYNLTVEGSNLGISDLMKNADETINKINKITNSLILKLEE